MKRILSALLVILLLISLAACVGPPEFREALRGIGAGDGADGDEDGTTVPFSLFGTRLVLEMPADWSYFYQHESAPWAFFSPEADAEFDVYPLETEHGETVDDHIDALRARSEAGDAGVRELTKLRLSGCSCLTYIDETGQNCAYIRWSRSEGYYVSCTDMGDGGQFFVERLKSMRRTLRSADAYRAGETEKYKGYEFELERVGLTAYIPNEYSFVEFDEEWKAYRFESADGSRSFSVGCSIRGSHTSPNASAEFMWETNLRNSDIRMTAEMAEGDRLYTVWVDRSTGALREAYVQGNHGFSVVCYGDMTVEQLRYFMDTLEDSDVVSSIDEDTPDDDPIDDYPIDDDPPAVEDNRCGVCRGTGICSGCHGQRSTRIPGFGGVGTSTTVMCAACGGTGRCRTCDGSGRR